MALNKITADSITDGTVIAADIADGTITTAKLASGVLPSATANSAASYANSSFLQANTPSYIANSAASYANSGFSQANTGVTNAATADDKAVSAGSYANSAFSTANNAGSLVTPAFNKANSAFDKANNALTAGANTSTSVQFGSFGVGTAASGTSGEIRATNNITAYYSSDKRYKNNIINIQNPLEKLEKINGVEFDWSEEYMKDHGGEDGYFIRKHDIGVIAQELEEILPEIVVTREDGYKAVKYDRIVALLIEALKELKKEVNSIKGK